MGHPQVGQATVDLSLHDQRIDDSPTIVHVDVLRERHLACFLIEIDDGRACTSGVGVGQRLPVRGRFQAPFQVAGQVARVIGLSAHLGPGDVSVGAVRDEELPRLQGHILRVTVEESARDLHGLGFDALAGLDDGGPSHHERAAGTGARPSGRDRRIAMNHLLSPGRGRRRRR